MIQAADVHKRRLEKGITLQEAHRELVKEQLLEDVERADSLEDIKQVLYRVIAAAV